MNIPSIFIYDKQGSFLFGHVNTHLLELLMPKYTVIIFGIVNFILLIVDHLVNHSLILFINLTCVLLVLMLRFSP